MSHLLSREHCAAAARQQGFQHYLRGSSNTLQQHAAGAGSGGSSSVVVVGSSSNSPANMSTSSAASSNSSSASASKYGVNTLAEMYEGVVGALFLDSNYQTVKQLMQPWVVDSFTAAMTAPSAETGRPIVSKQPEGVLGGNKAGAGSSLDSVSTNTIGVSSSSSSRQNSGDIEAASAAERAVRRAAEGAVRRAAETAVRRHVQASKDTSSMAVDTSITNSSDSVLAESRNASQDGEDLQQQLAAMLVQQVQSKCGYHFKDCSIVSRCSRRILQLLHSSAHESDSSAGDFWQFLGYSFVKYSAALHCYKQVNRQVQKGAVSSKRSLSFVRLMTARTAELISPKHRYACIDDSCTKAFGHHVKAYIVIHAEDNPYSVPFRCPVAPFATTYHEM